MLRHNLKRRRFGSILNYLKENLVTEDILSLRTNNGNTQSTERMSINLIRNCLKTLDYPFDEAGSQQSKDFRNVCKIGLNIEIKKTDGYTVYFNDTLPNKDIYYIIIFTGKEFKTKENILPQIIFINGYDLIKDDIYYISEYKKQIEEMKDLWCRKSKNMNANKFKYMSVYVRPTYKTDIRHLLNSEVSFQLKGVEQHSQSE